MKHASTYLKFLFISLLIAGCKTTEEDSAAQNESTSPPASTITVSRSQFESNQMQLAPVVMTSTAEEVRATGVIDVPPENRASVSPVMGGYVTHTPLLVGNKVNKGASLLTLENPEYVKLQQQYLEERESLKYLKEEYERHKELLKEKITSKKNYLRAESTYLATRSRVYGLEKQLQILGIKTDRLEPENITTEISLTAPISGSITEIHIAKGDYLQPSETAMEIVNNDHLHLELNVFEKDILKVQEGQEIEFRIPESSDKSFRAEVYLKSNALSENRTIRIHGHIPDSLRNVMVVGMYVEAVILTGDKAENSLPSVPEEAIIEKDGNYYLLFLENETADEYIFRKQAVSPGQTRNGLTSLEGLAIEEGARVLSKGAFDIFQ
ncbi:efflux RND transporter periplasmic adaptor subunit [Robertkochia marina]|uniref:Efflux RND transporter periplasmic adaptor subunit n=1 Tax=Robertkochia marina TaxID=1227945 RepID=A0A4S3LYQ1_9FLAO|nr:efflux RND transporter periplasmic adaptor subunit [Robertkochia marina]THD66740.1 efflux RND transporter periplasmic adaptor subunit [Robertkochia marina]TRZ42370.1 efflux RND transporter periplasmic adaptor subunit [Robertkochia marina]